MAIRLIAKDFPWQELAAVLTSLRVSLKCGRCPELAERIAATFPAPSEKAIGRRPLCESLTCVALTRLLPSRPGGLKMLVSGRDREKPWMAYARLERILWLALRICATNDYIQLKNDSTTFSVHPALESRLAEARERTGAVAKEGREGAWIPADTEWREDSGRRDKPPTTPRATITAMVLSEDVVSLKVHNRPIGRPARTGGVEPGPAVNLLRS